MSASLAKQENEKIMNIIVEADVGALNGLVYPCVESIFPVDPCIESTKYRTIHTYRAMNSATRLQCSVSLYWNETTQHYSNDLSLKMWQTNVIKSYDAE